MSNRIQEGGCSIQHASRPCNVHVIIPFPWRRRLSWKLSGCPRPRNRAGVSGDCLLRGGGKGLCLQGKTGSLFSLPCVQDLLKSYGT